MRTILISLLWMAAVAGHTGEWYRQQDVSRGVEIQRGNTGAIEDAVTMYDTARIPDLRALLTSGRVTDDSSIGLIAHDALAVLGDVTELQVRWCRAISQKPGSVTDRIQGLDVGGWFGIYSVSRLLSGEYRSRINQARAAFLDADPHADGLPGPIEEIPLRLLENMVPYIVPSPPPRWDPFPGTYEDSAHRAALAWLKWIDDNQAKLRRLRPTGDGVVFTAASCNSIH